MKGRDTNFTNFHEGETGPACTDLCFFDELEIGEYFYLPFQGATAEKSSATTYDGIGGEWRADMLEAVERKRGEPLLHVRALWLVARLDEMTCRRCGCRESSACHDERLGRACQWVSAGLCSACLDDREFGELVAEIEERRRWAESDVGMIAEAQRGRRGSQRRELC